MAITRPTSMTNFQRREGTPNIFVVVLSSAGKTWVVSTVDRTEVLLGITCFPLLKENPKISQSIDLYTRKSTIGHTTISLVNTKYRVNSSGVRVSLSDELLFTKNNINVTIYVMTGYGTTTSDMMQVFKGTVVGEQSYDTETLTLEVEDIGTELLNTKIPNVVVGDLLTEIDDNISHLPIVLGDWSDATTFGDIGYMVRCSVYHHDAQNQYIMCPAGHSIGSIESVWVYFEAPGLFLKLPQTQPFPYTVSGIECGIYSDSANIAGILYIPPDRITDETFGLSNILDFDDYENGRNNVLDSGKIFDHDHKTYGESFHGNVNNKCMIGFKWDDVGDPDKMKTIFIDTTPRGPGIKWRTGYSTPVTYLGEDMTPWVMSPTWIRFRFNAETNPDYDYTTYHAGTTWGSGIFIKWVSGVVRDSYFTELTDGGIKTALYNGITQNDIDLTSIDGHNLKDDLGWLLSSGEFEIYLIARTQTEAFDYMLRINAVALEIGVTINKTFSINFPVYALVKGMSPTSPLYDRFPSLGLEENALTWTGHQIEQLLRNLGVTTFDTTLNDTVYNANFKTRAILEDHSTTTVGAFVQELSENSNFATFFNISGNIRFVDLAQTPPTNPDKIYYENLMEPPVVSITVKDKIVNKLVIEYDYNPGSKYYTKVMTVENSTSQSLYGLMEKKAKYKYIVPGDINNIANLLVGNAGAFLANRHYVVSYKTKGFTWIHHEIGDWIQFDAGSLDPHLMFAGGISWSGQKFLIIKKSIEANGTTYEAIQLT